MNPLSNKGSKKSVKKMENQIIIQIKFFQCGGFKLF